MNAKAMKAKIDDAAAEAKRLAHEAGEKLENAAARGTQTLVDLEHDAQKIAERARQGAKEAATRVVHAAQEGAQKAAHRAQELATKVEHKGEELGKRADMKLKSL